MAAQQELRILWLPLGDTCRATALSSSETKRVPESAGGTRLPLAENSNRRDHFRGWSLISFLGLYDMPGVLLLHLLGKARPSGADPQNSSASFAGGESGPGGSDRVGLPLDVSSPSSAPSR